MREFECGEVVKLNSGSPDMTVVSCKENGDEVQYCRCAWFAVGCVEPLYGEFPSEALSLQGA